MPDQISWFEILTLVALVAGPVVAVIIARHMDTRRAERERRMDVFRTLMRTRRAMLNPEHVGAINLVEIEFNSEPNVIEAWKNYMGNLGEQHPRRSEEEVKDDMTPEEKKERDDKYWRRVNGDRDKLLAKLLHAIAKVMNFKIEQLDIFEGGYYPQGWFNIEMEQQIIRRFAVDLFQGTRLLPIAVVDYTKPASEEPDETKDDDADPQSAG